MPISSDEDKVVKERALVKSSYRQSYQNICVVNFLSIEAIMSDIYLSAAAYGNAYHCR